MRRQGGGGAIINITTVLALNGVFGVPCSAPIAAKGGLTTLTQNLAIELAPDNIRVNAVAPGVVPTPLHGELDAAQKQAMMGMQPLGRYGTPKDIADAVLYLANAQWVTGVVLPVDGGVTAGGDGRAHLKA
jgi:NAD(P)-dependent dehydrogenase (short-subunit alcohol dehydrogenase family)